MKNILFLFFLNCSFATTAPAELRSNDFSLKLYRELSKTNENLFFSPLSVQQALAMANTGAKGNTRAELEKVLGSNQNSAVLLSQKHEGILFRVANAMWGQKGYPFEKSFLETNRKQFDAAIEELDFSNESLSRNRINDWVEKKTEGRITQLIPPGSLSADTRLVLTNAIYFKAKWDEPFKPELTKNELFYVNNKRKITTPLMNRTGEYRYGESKQQQWIDLAYENWNFSMMVILPKPGLKIETVENNLTEKNIQKWASECVGNRVQLTLPKFKTTLSYELTQPLQKLGVHDAFSFEKANFSGINSSKEIFISSIVHKAFIDVNEAETEAAAATAIMMKAGAMPNISKPKVFRADRPFIYLIRHRESGTVLFIGKMSNPGN